MQNTKFMLFYLIHQALFNIKEISDVILKI